MDIFFTLIIGIVLGFVLAKLTTKKPEIHPTPKEKEIEERTQKIITYIREKGEVSNDDIQDLLGIADSTATLLRSEYGAMAGRQNIYNN